MNSSPQPTPLWAKFTTISTRTRSALTYLDRALELDTAGITVAYTFRTRGLIYSSQGNYEDAIQPYQAALQNAPNEGYIAVELANNYKAMNELDRAIQVLASVLEQESDRYDGPVDVGRDLLAERGCS